MSDFIRLYTPFVKNAFLRLLAYRLRYFTGIITYLLFVTVHYFIWEAVFAGRGVQARVNGFTLTEMVTYVAVGWISRSLYYSSADEEIDDLVRTGQISVYLIRPVNFQLTILAYALGQALFRLTFFTLPVGAVIVLAFPVGIPRTISDLLLFLFSTFLGGLILVEINFLIGMLAFSLQSTQGIIRAKYYIVQLCSGLLLPLSFFPGWAERILQFLPFQNIAFVPLQFYLGKIPLPKAASVLIMELMWALALFFAGTWAWKKSVLRLGVQGG